ncbi:MAG TPA: GTPase Era [Steroidobacteraceae bacterium]|nr:GTPase Era [Steroidobacteraceae bacterium]
MSVGDEGQPVTPTGGNDFRSGFAALVGRPNVGKSTLLNALVGQKISIVTPRPQTTRHRILGIVNSPAAQIAFVDTPGLHRGEKRALNRAMNRAAASALEDADLVVLVVEALRWTPEDGLVLERIVKSRRPAMAVVNKVDGVRPKAKLLPYLAELGARHAFLEIVPVSALKGDNLAALKEAIARHLPPGPALFPPDEVTDRGETFRIAETIREKLTMELNQEVPYGIAVEVERLAEGEGGQVEVDATIWVDREGQKPIVIGQKGERLKRIGRAARLELNATLGRRFHLTLWVKVRENWADNARSLRQLGLE